MSTKTIAFIHGNFVSKHCWDRWIARYEARGYTCTAIEWPGRDKPVAALKQNANDPVLSTLTIEAVIDQNVRVLRALPEKPIVIGHSFGGLLTQLMVQRDLAAAAVAIDSVPAFGVLTLEWSFLRSLWPVVNPFVPASRPYYMPFEHFQYSFANTLPLAEQRAGYDADIVPESRRLSRGAVSLAARVDFAKERAPLLMIAGEKDHIMPASLNRRNHRRYRKSPSVTDFKEFPGRDHYSVIGARGWEEVADYALDWAERQLAPTASGTSAHGRFEDGAPENDVALSVAS